MDGYIWTVEHGFYFSLPELAPTVYGPFASVMMATEAAAGIFQEHTATSETYSGAELNLVAVEVPDAVEDIQVYTKTLRSYG